MTPAAHGGVRGVTSCWVARALHSAATRDGVRCVSSRCAARTWHDLCRTRRRELLQSDDIDNDPPQSLDLVDASGSTEKTSAADIGGHTGVSAFAGEGAARYFERHLRQPGRATILLRPGRAVPASLEIALRRTAVGEPGAFEVRFCGGVPSQDRLHRRSGLQRARPDPGPGTGTETEPVEPLQRGAPPRVGPPARTPTCDGAARNPRARQRP